MARAVPSTMSGPPERATMSTDLRTNHELRDHIVAWLSANGVDPKNVPHDAYVSLVGDQLTTELYVRNDVGQQQFNAAQTALARTTATYTISVQPPADVAEWLRPRCPECGR